MGKVTRISIQELHESIGFEDEPIDRVDGCDVDRVTRELIARGGPDAVLGRFLLEKLAERDAEIDPESCV